MLLPRKILPSIVAAFIHYFASDGSDAAALNASGSLLTGDKAGAKRLSDFFQTATVGADGCLHRSTRDRRCPDGSRT